MDEIWKAAPMTEEYGRCYANKQRNHTKETGGKTAILCLKRGRSDKKEDDGWEAVLLRGGGRQAFCHTFHGLGSLSLMISRVYTFVI